MFESVRNNKLIVQGILSLIVLSFAVWGIGGYLQSAARAAPVASVGSDKISEQEFLYALNVYRDRLRTQMGDLYKPELLNAPEVREKILDSLIDKHLISQSLKSNRMFVPDAWIQDAIAAVPQFQKNGVFSKDLYEAALRAQGKTEAELVAQARESIAQQLLLVPVLQSAYAPEFAALRWLNLQDEEREIRQVVVSPRDVAGMVKLPEDAAKKYYEAHHREYEEAERVKLEYLVFDKAVLTDKVDVSEEDMQRWYKDNATTRFMQPEERRASHILIEAPAAATPEAKKQAKAKAEDLLKQVKAKPADFAKLAKEYSSDTLSAKQGGDLGFFRRNAMVKPFDNAVFSLKPGQISDIVETDFGYHIIRLTEVRGGKPKPYESVKAEIEHELKSQLAAKKFAESVDAFTDLVYSSADSLQPAATKYGLKIRTSDWISRDGKTPEPFNAPKLLAAIFSDDSLAKHHNTEAIDVGNNTYVSARVIEHKPAALRPFETVKADIEKKLTIEEENKAALKVGEEKLAQLKAGTDLKLEWTSVQKVKRQDDKLPPEAVQSIFKLAADKLPAYTGVDAPAIGYVIYKVERATIPELKADDPRVKSLHAAYSQMLGQEDARAYMLALRNRIGVTVHHEALKEAKEVR